MRRLVEGGRGVRDERADGRFDAGDGLGRGVAQARVEECHKELEGSRAGRVGDVRDDEQEDRVVRRRLICGVLEEELAAEEGDPGDVDACAAVVEGEGECGGVERDADRLDGIVCAEALDGRPEDSKAAMTSATTFV